jgi:hypothetical protein
MNLGIFALSGRQAEARELVPLVLKRLPNPNTEIEYAAL